jgi:hypothetical protein
LPEQVVAMTLKKVDKEDLALKSKLKSIKNDHSKEYDFN